MFATGATWLPRPLLRRPLRETLDRLFRADGETRALRPAGGPRLAAHPGRRRLPRQPARRHPVLEKRGHTVETVTTGAAAAAAVLASHYDLVLMDCRMPEMDGYDATALIRAARAGGAGRRSSR